MSFWRFWYCWILISEFFWGHYTCQVLIQALHKSTDQHDFCFAWLRKWQLPLFTTALFWQQQKISGLTVSHFPIIAYNNRMIIHMPLSIADSSIRCFKLNICSLTVFMNAAPDGNYYYHKRAIEPQQPEKTKADPKVAWDKTRVYRSWRKI